MAGAETCLRSQKPDCAGRLQWVPDQQLAVGRHDARHTLIEHHEDIGLRCGWSPGCDPITPPSGPR